MAVVYEQSTHSETDARHMPRPCRHHPPTAHRLSPSSNSCQSQCYAQPRRSLPRISRCTGHHTSPSSCRLLSACRSLHASSRRKRARRRRHPRAAPDPETAYRAEEFLLGAAGPVLYPALGLACPILRATYARVRKCQYGTIVTAPTRVSADAY